MVATDNFAVEAWPAAPDSPFVTDAERSGAVPRSGHTGLLHRVLIPLLGMVLGELWELDTLAAVCAADGRWDSLVVATPLNLTGGAGSPSNAVAIREAGSPHRQRAVRPARSGGRVRHTSSPEEV